MSHHSAIEPPMLTANIPGVGGRIKVQLEDFEVEEIPSYEPCGEGEHIYLWIQKVGMAPEFFTKWVAQKLQIAVNSIGVAGLKDRYAVTRQWISVPQHAESQLKELVGDGVTLLRHTRHTNKLKTGHSRGNTFSILIRDIDIQQKESVEQILDVLRQQGLPNYYGPQRFGRDGSTITLGFDCLAGKQPKRIRPFVYKFALSAVQSVLFNDYLGQRLNDGLFRTVLLGDVMQKWPMGGLFVVEDGPTEQSRFEQRETVPAGPMFGKRTFASAGVAAEREAAILAKYQLDSKSFDGFGKLMGGTRRNNLIYLDDLTSSWEPTGLRLRFSLPSGSYATVLLREIMKNEVPDASQEAPTDDEE